MNKKQINEQKEEFKNRTLRFLSSFFAVSLPILLILRHLISPLTPFQWGSATCSEALFLASQFLFSRARFNLSKISLFLGLYLIIIAAGLTAGGLRPPAIAFLVSLPAFGIWIAGTRVGLANATVSSLVLGFFWFSLKNGNIESGPLENPSTHADVTFLIYGFLTLTGIVAPLYYEAERKRSEKRSRLLQQLAELGTLSEGLAHEINNPLASIKLDLEILRTADPSSTESEMIQEKSFVRINNSISRIAGICSKLLNYSGVEFGGRSIQEISIRFLLEDWELQARSRLESRGIQLAFLKSIPTEAQIAGESDALDLAFSAIISNAEDALRHTSRPWIEVQAQKKGSWLEIRIKNNGPRLFSTESPLATVPFYSTHSPERHGLGLPLALRIIHDHGGELIVSEGTLTQFTIRLPLLSVKEKINSPALQV